jgi:flagellum-specific ATP synthase
MRRLPDQPVVEGRLLRMVGLTLEAEGLRAAVGSRCLVINDDSYHPVRVEAEVMGFAGSKVFLMPVGSIAGLAPARAWCRWTTAVACPWA